MFNDTGPLPIETNGNTPGKGSLFLVISIAARSGISEINLIVLDYKDLGLQIVVSEIIGMGGVVVVSGNRVTKRIRDSRRLEMRRCGGITVRKKSR